MSCVTAVFFNRPWTGKEPCAADVIARFHLFHQMTKHLQKLAYCPNKQGRAGKKESMMPQWPTQLLPCQGRPVPCRAQIWWIRAVPNISVPCPYDPCRAKYFRAVPCLVPAFWYQDLGTRHGTEIFGTARIIRARHRNIWHGTDPPDPGTARNIPDYNPTQVDK